MCSKCSTSKDLGEFPKNKNKSLGHGHTCRVCTNLEIDKYNKSMDGVITAIFNGQKRSSRYRKMPLPQYSKKEFKEWVTSQDTFISMYKAWVDSEYLKDMKPSVDRINDYESYTMDNIQLMTWKENRDKLHQDKVNGTNNKQSKAVVATIKGTTTSREFYSIAEACRVLGVDAKNVTYCCQNKPKYKSSGGYTWKYK